MSIDLLQEVQWLKCDKYDDELYGVAVGGTMLCWSMKGVDTRRNACG
jgi:hypothetical protein